MAGVPYVFGNATTSIPLTNLDANFNTGVTIGNTTVGLGNTVTTLGNVTLNNANFGAVANAVIYTNSGGNVTSNATIFSVNSGNVGIGTSSPNSFLSVKTSAGRQLDIVEDGTSSDVLMRSVAPNASNNLRQVGLAGTYISMNTGSSSGTTYSEAMRIDSSGNVGIGTNSPIGKLDVVTASGGAYIAVKRNSQSAGEVGLSLYGGTSGTNWSIYQPPSSNDIRFYGNGTDRLAINTNGAVALSGAVTTANGVGITFPATQSASSDANTLDDYEEGTWTPSWTSLTVVGTPTYTGKYIKVGRLVFCQLSIVSTTSTASTANITFFTGLPFAMTASDGNNSTMTAVNNTNVTSYGVGLVNSGVAYTPTWLASSNIVLSFSYMATN